MGISLDSLSFSSIYSSLSDYFNNQAQSQKWKDFYQSSAGRLFVRLLSAFGSFISYECTVNRREAFINYAQNRTSLIGIAQNLGYSVVRGKNEIIEMSITPIISGFIPEYFVVGTVKNYELVCVEQTPLNKGVPTTIKVYLGNLKTETLTSDTDGLKAFRFISQNVSDYFRILLNGSIVPTSTNLKDLDRDSYVAISNPLGAVDLMYLQQGNYKYQPSDVFTLQYIELAQVSYQLTDLVFDLGTINSISNISSYIPPESNDSIRVNAPLYHETQVRIRARNDYLKEFKNLGYNLADTNSHDFSYSIVDLSYVRNDYTELSESEKTNILSNLDDMRAMGIPLPRIINPKHFKLQLDLNIKRNTGDFTSIIDVESDIAAITNSYQKILSPSIDLESIERSIDDYSYVKRSRVSIHTTARANSTNYRLGDFIVLSPDNGKIYQAYDIMKQSGTLEPIWIYEAGAIITGSDGIVWRCLDKDNKYAPTWYSQRYYKVGDLVSSTSLVDPAFNYIFECIQLSMTSGASMPTFSSTLQDFTEDNQLIWVTKPRVTSDSAWQSNTVYNLGDSVTDGNPSGTFSYEVVGFIGTSKVSQPVFKTTDNYPIVSIDQTNKIISVAGNYTQHFLANDTVRVIGSTGNDGYYKILSSNFNGVNTDVYVDSVIPNANANGNLYMEDNLTKDGNILWKYYDSTNVLFNFNWNEYIIIKNNIYLP